MTERSRNGHGQATPTGRKPDRLTRRADYVATAKGRRFHSASLTLQAVERADAGDNAARFGLTVSRKVGNAVVRNRVKRRLREAVKHIEAAARVVDPIAPVQDAPTKDASRLPAPGWDYVIVARTPALTQPFGTLVAEITADLSGVHAKRRSSNGAAVSGAGHKPRSHSPRRTLADTPSSPETR